MTEYGKILSVGISGWTYASWCGVFYPNGLPHRQEAFLRRPRSGRSRSTARSTACNGRKASRAGARRRRTIRLRDQGIALHRPYAEAQRRRNSARQVLRVRHAAAGAEARAPSYGNSHPAWASIPTCSAHSCGCCPATTKAASLAQRHDARMQGRAWTPCDVEQPLRHAIEIRHDSFRSEAFIALLRRYGAALVCADAVDWPRLMDVTSDFVYCRLHGSEELYVSGYDDAALDRWAARARAWAVGGEEPEDAERVAGLARKEPKRAGMSSSSSTMTPRCGRP